MIMFGTFGIVCLSSTALINALHKFCVKENRGQTPCITEHAQTFSLASGTAHLLKCALQAAKWISKKRFFCNS